METTYVVFKVGTQCFIIRPIYINLMFQRAKYYFFESLIYALHITDFTQSVMFTLPAVSFFKISLHGKHVCFSLVGI
jgi:hypothetical protein